MNKIIKKTAAVLAGAAVVCTAASCKGGPEAALTVNGEDIRSGIYIFYQMEAAGDAAEKLREEQPDIDQSAVGFDLLKYNIEGKPAESWIKEKAVELCKEYAATNAVFNEYGLSLSADQLTQIKSTINNLWSEENMYAQMLYGVDVMGDYYEEYGIGKQSYTDIYKLSYEKNAIFSHLYDEGGAQSVSADELNKLVKENNALAMYFEVDPDIGSADDFTEKLKSGASFAEVKQEYDRAVRIAEIEADMADAAAEGETYEGEQPEDVVVELQDEKTLKHTIAKESTTPSEDFVKTLFQMSNDECRTITVTTSGGTNSDGTEVTSTKYYVVKRLDITSDEEVMTERRNKELHDLKDSELEKLLSDKAAGLSVSEKPEINKYKASKFIRKNEK